MIYQQIQILFIHSGIGQMQPSSPLIQQHKGQSILLNALPFVAALPAWPLRAN
jgi:hypothetical protein